MNTEPPTGDDLERLLVVMKRNVLEQATDKQVRQPHRHVGLVIGLVALVTIGSASGAAALGILPHPFTARAPIAPATTSLPTPSATATPPAPPSTTPPAPPADSVPASTVPTTCGALATSLGVSNTTVGVFSPPEAVLQQRGVLSCLWTVGGESLFSVDISTNTSGAHDWIASRLASGNASIGIDAESALGCQTLSTGCDLSLLGSRYWIEGTLDGSNATPEAAPAVITPLAQKLVDRLSALTPITPWQQPPTSWSSLTSCSALRTSTPMAGIFGSPGMVGPSAVNPGSMNGIQRDFEGLRCFWGVPDSQAVPSGAARSVSVSVAPGGVWAYKQAAAGSGSTPVTVTGSDEAVFSCNAAEGEACWLNVLSDNAWLQIGFGDGFTSSSQGELIKAAEALLAAHS